MKTNEELRKDVMEEIKWDPQLRDVNTQIGVSVKNGVVTLSGMVDTYAEKLAAEKAAQRVLGVKVVATDIEVRVRGVGVKTDTEIAEIVSNALLWNSAVNHDQIEIKVDNGWVYLSGKVDWGYERFSAEDSVSGLLGVRGVTNNITVKSRDVNTKEIKTKISDAFQRNARIDSSNIRIETLGSKVTLRGKVRSWAERKDAESVAWSAPGVMSVDNQIEIDMAVYA